ncbi:transcription factor 25 [Sceloporus undulatus]|uniref:transcription factor 25 n=1 Tax=Sceloporus undulatus TaxID=8520 RepID=UPI001C4D6FE3|nr:transcription factor 25 [Sceloporus undulatus]
MRTFRAAEGRRMRRGNRPEVVATEREDRSFLFFPALSRVLHRLPVRFLGVSGGSKGVSDFASGSEAPERGVEGPGAAGGGTEAAAFASEGDRGEKEEEEEEEAASLPQGRRVANLFELITNVEDDLASKEEKDGCRLQEEGDRENQEEEPGNLESDKQRGGGGGGENEQLDQTPIPNNKSRKKKKKRKNKKNASGETPCPGEEENAEDIESILVRIENSDGPSCQSQSRVFTDSRPLLYVEHRNLNPETELKRYFGARAVLGDHRPRQRQRQHIRSTWLTVPKSTWPRHSKTGISMALLETKRGIQHFAFEHHREYQQVQFKFLDAVESMDPNNLVLLLQMNPSHVDSLLQLSDVCRMQEDQEMARDLVERALHILECAFHPMFSLTSGTCQLDYRRPENRAFYLALFKHMVFLERRGCPRTALEFCKLILSLDPENDPLCMLLIIDLLSLRAREYTFLTRLFCEWEGHRNLSQLPNFAFSVPLAYFFLSQQEDVPEVELSQAHERAASLIQQALIMFPSVLMPLLDRCSVQPDAMVAAHSYFGLEAQLSSPPALNQLVSLYLGRTHSFWKDPSVMAWLETNVHEVLRRVDSKDPALEEVEQKRKVRYQNAPRNVYRHVILSEIREATAALPPEVTSLPIMGFDPLPPLDSIVSYTRPERSSHPSNESTLSLFFRSLLPNFNLQGENGAGGEEGPGAGQNLNQGVNRLMAAMRDMLANIQFQEPPRDDNPEGDAGEWD